MSHDLTFLENDLKHLRPAALDESLMERLEGCAAGNWDNARPLELEIEHRLRGQPPAALDDAMVDRILGVVADAPFPKTQPKILPFPPTATAPVAPRRAPHGGRWLAAAAVVAIMGALAGWFLPQGTRSAAPLAADQAPASENRRPAPPPNIGKPPMALVPAGLNRGLSEATDEGVVLYGNRRPHRVLKFVYQEQVTLKDDEGRTYQVEQPRIEYLIVPAKTD